MILCTSSALTKSGTVGNAGLSSPSNVTSSPPDRAPAALRTSCSRAPVHTALPMAPSPHWPPRTRGANADDRPASVVAAVAPAASRNWRRDSMNASLRRRDERLIDYTTRSPHSTLSPTALVYQDDHG